MTKQKESWRGVGVGQRGCVWGSAKKELTTNFFVVLLISEVKGNQEVREKDASKRGQLGEKECLMKG